MKSSIETDGENNTATDVPMNIVEFDHKYVFDDNHDGNDDEDNDNDDDDINDKKNGS